MAKPRTRLDRDECREIEEYARIVGMAVAFHLYKGYIRHFNEEVAVALASAVSCQLLGTVPGRDTELFLDGNGRLVEGAIEDIRGEPEICYITSIVAHARAGAEQAVPPKMLETTGKLKELGIILPREEVQVPGSREALMLKAREFELWALNN